MTRQYKLTGVAPVSEKNRFKAFFYGLAGVGKSTAAINFPAPYWIDTDVSSSKPIYAKIIQQNEGNVLVTQDFDEMLGNVHALLNTKHPFKTLVIDSMTLLYNDLVDKSAEKLRRESKEKDATGQEFGRHYGEANKEMKKLFNLLLRLDMNVIITAQAKKEYGDNLKVIGTTFDCYKSIDYIFDLVIEVQKRGPLDRVGIIKKTRLEEFPDGETFPFSYEEIARRYGKEILEKKAVPVPLITDFQLKEIKRLIELLHIEEKDQKKWFTKEKCSSLEDLSEDFAIRVINHYQTVIKGESAA